MATQRAIDEADIRRRVDTAMAALRAMDLDRLMTLYAPDIVSFDIAPPLRYAGADTKRKVWSEAFAAFQPPLDYEVRDLTITLGDDVAFGHSLNHISATLRNGNKTEFWLRWTSCFRKVGGNWLIAHEHVSVPFDPETGKGVLNLKP